MIDTIVKISCDWCSNYEEAGKNRVDLKGKRIRIGEKTFRKKCEKYHGWINVVEGGKGVLDFCGKECYDHYKQDQNKP